MLLSDWAAAPMASPPPIPLSTDAVSASNHAYRIGAIPPDALADDLAAAGLTYSPDRGNGYRRNGGPLDPYFLGDILAQTFTEASQVLDYFLGSDAVMLTSHAARDERDRLPFRDRDAVLDGERRRLSRVIDDAEKDLPLTFNALEQASNSLSATGRAIRGFPFVRTEAIRRFRVAIPAPVAPADKGPADLAAFLASFAAGDLIARPALREGATFAGLTIGSRTLYAAAVSAGWRLSRRKGYDFYRVPSATP